jgi:hypothetical protein
MKKTTLLFLICFLSSLRICAQIPTIQWQKSLGGSSSDDGLSVQKTPDGGYVVLGYSSSTDGDLTNTSLGYSANWLIKLDSAGSIQWQKSFGHTDLYVATTIRLTNDGGYIVAGTSNSNAGDLTGNHGFEDYWVAKLDNTGAIVWEKSYGGSAWDTANAIQQTTDGGYIIIGESASNDGNVAGNHGAEDYWVIKVTSTGILQWQKCLGGSWEETGKSIQQTTDGGYIVAGISDGPFSSDGEVTGHHSYSADYWIVKLSNTGNIQWQKSLGGSDRDEAYSIKQTTDGGYIVAGNSNSTDGNVTGNHGAPDYWIVKLNSTGNIQWQKSFGGAGYDEAFSIQQTTDGGYIAAGFTETLGAYNYWVVKLSSAGALQWQKALGGSAFEMGSEIQQTTDGGYIIVGYSESNDGDVTGHHGMADCWVVKLGTGSLEINDYENTGIAIYPNPTSSSVTINCQNLISESGWSIKISNALGQDIFSGIMNSREYVLPLSTLTGQGIYFLRIYDPLNNLLGTKKIILQ